MVNFGFKMKKVLLNYHYDFYVPLIIRGGTSSYFLFAYDVMAGIRFHDDVLTYICTFIQIHELKTMGNISLIINII